ncbi:MAG TPA: serine hydrolase [Rhizomicrobium sp.]|nr:serine hydrolase [Rhizomicrobium sp.]
MRLLRAAVAAALVAGLTAANAQDSPLPPASGFLFWTPAQQRVGYRSIEKIFPVRIVKRGGTVSSLPNAGLPFDVSYEFNGKRLNTAGFMAANNVSGLLIVQGGKVLLERYGLGRGAHDRWTSFSVAKSVTSTLVGAAIKDGFISGLDAEVTTYLPELKGTAYDGVRVRDLITMRSGLKWNEDYSNPKSDVNRFGIEPLPKNGEDPVEAYLARLPRAHRPGTVFNYNTGETDLAGILVARATRRHLADYLSERIWSKIGAEQDAVWMLDRAGEEFGGCCLSMTLRDYARFGLFFMHGGRANGEEILPSDWVEAASAKQTPSDFGKLGYGYFWWIHPDGSYEAIGIFGQSILIVPKQDLVVVTNSAWPEADADRFYAAHDAYVSAVRAALRPGSTRSN